MGACKPPSPGLPVGMASADSRTPVTTLLCWLFTQPYNSQLQLWHKVYSLPTEATASLLLNRPITCSIATPDNFVYDFRGGVALDKDYNKSEVRISPTPKMAWAPAHTVGV